MHKESIPVALARGSLSYFLETSNVMPVPEDLTPDLLKRAGVFVSLKKAGTLRGCIGTFLPTRKNIAEEIIYNAIAAGTEDPRFWEVELEELPEIIISVDVLGEPEYITKIVELNPQKYGVIVKYKNKTGLLLPMLEGVDTVEEQIAIAKQKAGIKESEKAEMYKFEVKRYL